MKTHCLGVYLTLHILVSTSVVVNAQYVNTMMLTTNGAALETSGTYGICLFCSVSNTSNAVDAVTTNYATFSIPAGLGGGGYLKVSLPTIYPAGTRIGWVADVNGGVAGLLNNVTLRAYLNGTQVGSASGGTLFNVLGIGGGTNISAVFCSPFNEIRIDMGSFLSVLATYKVYYSYVTIGGSFPVQCGSASDTEVCGDNIDNDGDGLIDGEDTCVTPCNAGTTAPIMSAAFKTNFCPSTTANLTSLTANNTPSGATLTWHTGTPATSANMLTTAQAQSVGAGTYYAAFYDATNSCFSNSGNGTTAVTVSILSCCNAGSTAPSVSSTKINTCPALTANLTTITASNTPSGTTLTWHTSATASLLNKMTTLQAQTALAGTYYAAFYDATNACFSTATTPVAVSISSCFSTSAPPAQTATIGEVKSGTATLELLPTGGTPLYTYSNDAGNPTCVALSGANAFTGLTVNSLTGTYSYTAPLTSGAYYYCIRVCDSGLPSANCQTQTYSLIVSASCTDLSQRLNKQ
ncbi:MAG: hypothetical protein JNL70_09325 [Saprospiraceae bacterium]|nr:hypothetical protein [Saprospiraceae bacterium]